MFVKYKYFFLEWKSAYAAKEDAIALLNCNVKLERRQAQNF